MHRAEKKSMIYWEILKPVYNLVIETVTEKVMDVLEKFMNPIDDTAEKIKSALSSSPGDYKAVPIEAQVDISTKVQKTIPRVRGTVNFIHMEMELSCRNWNFEINVYEFLTAHVPGRAGGGWESDDDEVPELHTTNSSRTVSVDSLEKYFY